jgi:P-type Na+/K+ transporter
VITTDSAKQRPELENVLLVSSICNTAFLTFDTEVQKWKTHGDPTEIALCVLASKIQYSSSDLGDKYTFLAEFSFESVLKRMTTVYERKSDSQCVYFTKGALERVLAVCRDMCRR